MGPVIYGKALLSMQNWIELRLGWTTSRPLKSKQFEVLSKWRLRTTQICLTVRRRPLLRGHLPLLDCCLLWRWGCWRLSQLHVGVGRIHSWMSRQLIAGPYLSIWGIGTLLKGNLAVPWRCSGTSPSTSTTFQLLSTARAWTKNPTLLILYSRSYHHQTPPNHFKEK